MNLKDFLGDNIYVQGYCIVHIGKKIPGAKTIAKGGGFPHPPPQMKPCLMYYHHAVLLIYYFVVTRALKYDSSH